MSGSTFSTCLACVRYGLMALSDAGTAISAMMSMMMWWGR